jgi:hypothetical protein
MSQELLEPNTEKDPKVPETGKKIKLTHERLTKLAAKYPPPPEWYAWLRSVGGENL